MQAISEFLQMGGYGAFVWPAFAVAAVVMVALLVASLRQARANQTALDLLEATRPARRGARRAGASGEGADDP